uniref:F5/8 type C domain-containing protein n=2 Tax=Haptolina brevifila TaxID=156173 RepID=A0A7S2J593_9EUKA|mmetsp:Transcript_76929/g.152610  ORF Transcript_76929/g.152610 Transcript_76929/m.152610 type:complete len:474 (+) Transcript_76929:293-1714(+)
MRYIVGSWASHDEMDWARENCPNKARDKIGETTHGMVAYRKHNADGADIHGPSPGKNYYGGPVTMEAMHRIGGVCGNISKFGVFMANAHGIPALQCAQTGKHACFLWQNKPGTWRLSNDVFGWGNVGRWNGIQLPFCGHPNAAHFRESAGFHVVMMEKAQTRDYRAFCRAERLRTLASVAPIEKRGDLLAEACEACPFNMDVWADRAQYLSDARNSGHAVNDDAWVAKVKESMKDEWLHVRKNVATCKPVIEQDGDKGVQRVVSGGGFWGTGAESSWLEIDLQEPCRIEAFNIVWWGISVASTLSVLVSDGSGDYVAVKTLDNALDHPMAGQYNGSTLFEGWDQITRKIKVTLDGGRTDPWGKGKLFGIRSIQAMGISTIDISDEPASEVMKLAASFRLDKERLDTETSENAAADASDRLKDHAPSNKTVLALTIDYIHELIEKNASAEAEERTKEWHCQPLEDEGDDENCDL